MKKMNGQGLVKGQTSFLPGAKGRTPIDAHWNHAEFQETYPAVYQLLAMATDEDGSPREGASLILFAESDRLKGCLVDKHTGNRTFFVLDGMQPIFAQIEAALQNGVEWKAKKDAFGATPTH